MAFYSQDPNLGELLAANLAELTEQTSADLSQLSVTWLVPLPGFELGTY